MHNSCGLSSDSAIGVVVGCRLDNRAIGIQCLAGPTDVAALSTSMPALGLIQPHIEGAEGPFLSLKRSMCSSNHSPLFTTEFKMRGAIRLFPLYTFVARVDTTLTFFVKEANKTVEDNVASC